MGKDCERRFGKSLCVGGTHQGSSVTSGGGAEARLLADGPGPGVSRAGRVSRSQQWSEMVVRVRSGESSVGQQGAASREPAMAVQR